MGDGDIETSSLPVDPLKQVWTYSKYRIMLIFYKGKPWMFLLFFLIFAVHFRTYYNENIKNSNTSVLTDKIYIGKE